ncbi:MAG: DUF2269 family protein [Thiohalomonadales bacterium]
MDYLILKWLHIISSTILFGTGLGSAFYKYVTDRTNNIHAIAETNKIVVLADWIFTTPTIIIQPITGYLLVTRSGFSLTDSWLVLSVFLFILTGLCWIPVVFLQIKMRNLSIIASQANISLPASYYRYTKVWFYLGIPAFIAMLGIFYLMSNKPVFF